MAPLVHASAQIMFGAAEMMGWIAERVLASAEILATARAVLRERNEMSGELTLEEAKLILNAATKRAESKPKYKPKRDTGEN